MKKILFLFLLSGTLNAFSQIDAKSIKKLEKAERLVNKQKFDDAELIYRNLLKEHPYYSTVWNIYTDFAYTRYRVMQKNLSRYSITVSTKDGESTDSLANALNSLLSKVLDPSQIYYQKYIDVCREATLKNEYAHKPSFYLRTIYFDKKVDQTISDSARQVFNVAERKFVSHNYVEAIEYYQKAVAIDSNFYKARLYIGDSYFALKDYVGAIPYFRDAIRKEPMLIEPRKYLVDALLQIGSYDEAYEECVKALTIYPDAAMFNFLDELSSKKGKQFNRGWISRELLPKQESPVTTKDPLWKHYLDAKRSFDTSYYDAKTGLIKPNPLTTQKYVEVYCWEQLLKNTPQTEFKEARKMQEKGYLDCYVLFSLYHIDVLDQYKHLAQTDRAHLRSYIDLLSQ